LVAGLPGNLPGRFGGACTGRIRFTASGTGLRFAGQIQAQRVLPVLRVLQGAETLVYAGKLCLLRDHGRALGPDRYGAGLCRQCVVSVAILATWAELGRAGQSEVSKYGIGASPLSCLKTSGTLRWCPGDSGGRLSSGKKPTSSASEPADGDASSAFTWKTAW